MVCDLAGLMRVSLIIGLCSGSAVAQQALHVWTGSTGAELGRSVASGGDVDADGFGDVVTGWPMSGDLNTERGYVAVYSGRTSAELYRIQGDSDDGQLGHAVCGVGDVDADGFDDFLAGAPFHDGFGRTDNGLVRVYSGRQGTVIYSLLGNADLDRFGSSVSAAGDVNNDGFPDILVGAPDADGNGKLDSGEIQVHSGSNGAVVHRIAGPAFFDHFGQAVSGAGDVNGDGFDDLIVGSPRAGGNHRGSAVVISGLTGSNMRGWNGAAAGDQLGFAVSGAGHVNGDAFADIVIGTPFSGPSGTNAGELRVYSGFNWAELDAFFGNDPNGWLGYAISGGGDIDDDGHADVIVGEPMRPPHGAVWALSGLNGDVLRVVSNDVDYGEGQFGFAVGGATDINADGFSDILVGDPFGRELPVSAGGLAWVFSGSCGSNVQYGTGCVGSGGFTPTLSMAGCAAPGGRIELEVTGTLGGAGALLVLGQQRAASSMGGGCTLNVATILAVTGAVVTDGSGPGNGWTTFAGTLPFGVSNVALTAQGFVLDAGVPRGLANTNGLELILR